MLHTAQSVNADLPQWITCEYIMRHLLRDVGWDNLWDSELEPRPEVLAKIMELSELSDDKTDSKTWAALLDVMLDAMSQSSPAAAMQAVTPDETV